MKTYRLLLPLILLIVSCSGESKVERNTDSKTESKEMGSEKEEQKVDEAGLAEQWLKDAIETHFSKELPDFKTITTKEYYEYKIDVINSNFDGGLDLDAIKKKWSHKYKVTADDIEVGFLIDAQDNGKIEIESCKQMDGSKAGQFVFSVSLYDTQFKTRYKSDITVIPYKGSYAIDYVNEHFK